ncbi:MAG TPA: MmgE/PrpD family protein, partial [Acidimicrobiia bacterium]|nr:MmgE/PrpD family protein [Acidimicrobiia bacterium]
LTGWSSSESDVVFQVGRRLFGQGDSTVIGGPPLPPAAAAMVNGYLITARSLCDVHQPTLSHVTPVTVPAVLAGAGTKDTDGPTLLASLAVAFESMVRVCTALDYPQSRSRGWHSTGVVGPIAAALGVARVRGFDESTTSSALGIAAMAASGTFAAFGTPTIKYNQSRAALNGLLAAELAGDGFRGPESVLTNPDGGLFNTHSDGGLPQELNDLGDTWSLHGITTRLWPAAAALQSVLTLLLANEVPAMGAIEKVTVSLSPASYEMNAEMGWATGFEAQLSARFVTSVVLHDRTCWLDQYGPDRLNDEEISEFASDRIQVDRDPTLPEGGSAIRIESGGDVVEWRLENPKGDPLNPASWDETAAKFHKAADGVLPPGKAVALVDQVHSLETQPAVADLLALLGTAHQSA